MPRPKTRFRVELLKVVEPMQDRWPESATQVGWARRALAVVCLAGAGVGGAWWYAASSDQAGPQRAWADIDTATQDTVSTLAALPVPNETTTWRDDADDALTTVPEALFDSSEPMPTTEVAVVEMGEGLTVQLEIDPEELRVDAEAGTLVFETPASPDNVNQPGRVLEESPEATASQNAQATEAAPAETPSNAPVWRPGGGMLSPDFTETEASPVAMPEAIETQPDARPQARQRPDETPRGVRGVTPSRPLPDQPAAPVETPRTPASNPPAAAPSAPGAAPSLPSGSSGSSSGSSDSSGSSSDSAALPGDLTEEPPAEDALPQTERDFIFWNALLFLNQPSHVTENPDFPPLHVVYGAHIWHSADEDHSYAREDRIRAIARSIAPGTVVCYDIEHWRMVPGSDKFERELQNFLDIVRWTKEENPTLKVGFYSMLPELRPDVAQLPETHPRWDDFRVLIESRQELIDAVDVIFPWLYTMIDVQDMDEWEIWARKSLRESRRIAPDKPVYPFIWFRYHQINWIRKFQWIEDEYWLMKLNTLREISDGVVIWGGHRQVWREDMRWWQLTEPMLGKPVPVRWGD